ncbi:sulfur carrier protein ThiS [Komagataeibacter medellinensis]|uniref:Sulfur carrier protein ThiS n=1 Tax=Komagataeibacter medellinensis TaxID=1177712 RepID=A0ABQ6VY52_9PROT|nr:sulfur carrier protein ThiS [Komagataeibacter medellinensis]KAB8125145.1 sulfur carrier protein ThiS [Komagataeibacter medellinensis]
MQIMVNDERRDVVAVTLAAVLTELGYATTSRVATAVDGRFVPAGQRAAMALHEGARVEILAPMQGG